MNVGSVVLRSCLLAGLLLSASASQTQTGTANPPLVPGVGSSPATTPAPPPATGAIAAHPDWPAATPADVASVENIVNALYNVISGPAGQPRNWNRMRSLFVPEGGRLVLTRASRPGTTPTAAAIPAKTDVVFLSVDQYIDRFKVGAARSGFFESPLFNRIDTFGEMTNVWSTYASRHAQSETHPFARGINSIELLHSGDRYYIVQVYWDAERPGNPIPTKYLPAP